MWQIVLAGVVRIFFFSFLLILGIRVVSLNSHRRGGKELTALKHVFVAAKFAHRFPPELFQSDSNINLYEINVGEW